MPRLVNDPGNPALILRIPQDEPIPPEGQGVEPDIPSGGVEDGEWMLTLVNPWNPLPEDYTFTVKALSNGHHSPGKGPGP